ncbi:MAG: hypothetical protein FWF75_04505 [Propionibacteriaceae bacterium]|nr:hypothetical protein [Propionibacteriaceae bacterium]
MTNDDGRLLGRRPTAMGTRLRVDALPQSTGILPDTPGALKRHLDQSRREAAEHPERLVPMDQFEHQMRSKLAAL